MAEKEKESVTRTSSQQTSSGPSSSTGETVSGSGSGSITRDELDRILAERDKKHAEELAAVKVVYPTAQVPQNSGGPGIDNHQVSWSLAEQEAANRGEMHEHWE